MWTIVECQLRDEIISIIYSRAAKYFNWKRRDIINP